LAEPAARSVVSHSRDFVDPLPEQRKTIDRSVGWRLAGLITHPRCGARHDKSNSLEDAARSARMYWRSDDSDSAQIPRM
jgi:hypothetical protein